MSAKLSLVVSIVRKGWGSTVLDASIKAGARGGTVLFGRGAGINEREKIFGVSIEPEKEVLLSLVLTPLIPQVLNGVNMIPVPHLNQLTIFNCQTFSDGPSFDHLTATADMSR